MKKLCATLVVAALSMGFNVGMNAGEEKEITGTLGCAHCTFHEGKSCAVGVKTADGKVDIVTIANKEQQKALFKARLEKSGKTIVVKGEVEGDTIKASSTKIED